MNQFDPETHSDGLQQTDGDNPPALARALLPHAHRLIPLVGGMLLITEAILAIVVIFSRMSAFQQFVCVVLIVVLPTAALALAVTSVARASRPRNPAASSPAAESRNGSFPMLERSPWNPEVRRARVPSADSARRFSASNPDGPDPGDLHLIVEQLEEMSLRTRRLPFNVVVGLDEEQFTYLLVKLRATAQALISNPETVREPRGLLGDGEPIFPMEQIERIQSELRGTRQDDQREEVPFAPPEKVVEDLMTDEPAAEEIMMESVPELRIPASVVESREALRAGDSEAAIQGLKNLLLNNPEDAEAAELLGVAYERSGDLESALKAMRVAVLSDPRRSTSHFNYAVLLSKADRLIDAYRQNEVALRLNPEYGTAREFQKLLHNRIVAQQNGSGHAVVAASAEAVPS